MSIGRCRVQSMDFRSQEQCSEKGEELYILRKSAGWFMGIKLPMGNQDVLHAVIGTFPRCNITLETSSEPGNMRLFISF